MKMVKKVSNHVPEHSGHLRIGDCLLERKLLFILVGNARSLFDDQRVLKKPLNILKAKSKKINK